MPWDPAMPQPRPKTLAVRLTSPDAQVLKRRRGKGARPEADDADRTNPLNSPAPTVETLEPCFSLARYRTRGVEYRESPLLPEAAWRLSEALKEAAVTMGEGAFVHLVHEVHHILSADDAARVWREAQREAAGQAVARHEEDRAWPSGKSRSVLSVARDRKPRSALFAE